LNQETRFIILAFVAGQLIKKKFLKINN